MAYITYFDLLGTRGFCEDSNTYYNNIKKFNKAVTQTATLLLNYGKVGIFSDSVYASSTDLKQMLVFLTSLRRRLMAERLFFNAVVKKGELSIEPVGNDNNYVFGVAFTDSAIADLYIAQTNFKGIGIFIDQTISDEEIEGIGYKTTRCFFMKKNVQGDRLSWEPVAYRDISLSNATADKKLQNAYLEVFLRSFYSSYLKAPKFGAYYVSLFCNYIRSITDKLQWNVKCNKFFSPPPIIDVIYNMAMHEAEMLSHLPGLDCLVFALLDEAYASPDLNEIGRINVTKELVKLSFVRDKCFPDLDNVPRNIFTEQHWVSFVRYCQEDFASSFIDNILPNS